MWKWIIAVVLAAVLVGGCIGGGVWLAKSGKLKGVELMMNPGAKGTEVRVEKPRRGDLVRTISAPGTIDPRTKVEISAQVSARIISLPFREGQAIKKGDVVVKLDAVDLAAALDSAKARLASEHARLLGVRAAMENTERELRRRKELLDTRDIAPEEYESTQTAYDQSKSAYEQNLREIDIAQANVKRAEKDLANTTIQSTIDGFVTFLDAEVGELVVVGTLNSPGSVIMQLANLSDMLMKAKVDESNVSPVAPGQKCRVFINAYPGKEFTGEVERIRPTKQTDTDGTTYFETEIRVDLPKDNSLRGMLANVDIEVQTLRDIVKVPTQSIVDRSLDDLPAELVRSNPQIDRNKKFARIVFKLVNGKAIAIPVSIGPSDLADTVILAGLSPDDTIITGPYKSLISLKNDQVVTIKTDDAADAPKSADNHDPDDPDGPDGDKSRSDSGGPG